MSDSLYDNALQNDSDEKNSHDPDKYQVKMDVFEGPLDLLLHLIKTSEIDIYDIEISLITKQYLSYLSYLLVLDIENISEFVDMATVLILIKSKAMLPVEVEFEEEQEDPREELIAKLLEYQKYKIAAGLLETKSEESIPLVNRSNDPGLFKIEESPEENWKKLSVLDLIEAFAKVLNKNRGSEMRFEVVLHNYTVEDKIVSINDLLKNSEGFNFFEVIKDCQSKFELVCTFLALLEMVKKGIIAIRQHIIFGDIQIVRKRILSDDELYGDETENTIIEKM